MPRTPEEFVASVAAEDLDIACGLFATDKLVLFADASHTLFRVRSLIYIVVVVQDDVLGYGELLKEHDELKDMCKVLEQRNFDIKKKMVVLRENIDALISLAPVLDAWIRELKVSLAGKKKCSKKVSTDVAEAC